MSVTVSTFVDYPHDADKLGVVDLSLDSNYPSGGYELSADQFGMREIKHAIPLAASKGVVLAWDGKIKVFHADDNGLTEVPAGTDLSGVKVYVLVAGV